MAPKYTLYYFNGRGRAEIARLVLAATGTEFNDVRIESSEWPQRKQDFPTGKLPCLEVDGKKMPESVAITRYLARETGLDGQTSLQQAFCDALVDQLITIRELFIAQQTAPAEGKAKAAEKYKTDCKPLWNVISGTVAANKSKSGWLIHDSMTWADIVFYAVAEMIKSREKDYLKAYPKLEELYQKVASQAKVAAYLKSRPETQF